MQPWESGRPAPSFLDGNLPEMGAVTRLYEELAAIGLLENVAQLDVFGFTVVPPDKVGPPALHDAVREALDRALVNRFGPSGLESATWADKNQVLRFMLWDDPVFEELLLNPAALGLVQLLLGHNCILSLFSGWVKGAGRARTAIHPDHWDFTRKTFAGEPASANFNYLVSDYGPGDGPLTFVPGSHKWHRRPSPEEGEYWADRSYPITAPAGSMVVWGDQTWHGSLPRERPGERRMIVATFSRPYLQTQEPFRETVTSEALARNPVRFAGLMDVYGAFPIGKDDLDAHRLAEHINDGNPDTTPYRSLFDRQAAGGLVSRRPNYDYLTFDVERWASQRQARADRSAAPRTRRPVG